MLNWLKRWLTASDPDLPAEEETGLDERVVLELGDVFDLHTIAPRDVCSVVGEYLREAYRMGFGSVRIIHGKGIGQQRQAVRDVLARTSFVDSWTDAPLEAGSWGATIVYFSRRD